MKPILVLTDFSSTTDTALSYAVNLAKVSGSSIVLLNTYELPVTMNDFPVLMVSAEDLKKAADASLAGSKEEALKRFPGVNFETESRLGEALEVTATIASERNALCIVIGTQKLSGLEKFLFGNDTISLIRISGFPVVVVPEHAAVTPPRNIVLAADLLHTEDMPVAAITSFVQALQAQLHIVHVKQQNEETIPLESLQQSFDSLQVSFHTIQNEDVAEGLKTYLDESQADLLMLLPHKHSFYENLFSKTHTQGIIEAVTIPIVCLQN